MCLSKFSRTQQFSKYKYRDYFPCGKCGKHCDKNESFIISCGICEKYYHRSCIKLSKREYKRTIENNFTFICDRKCYASVLPFSASDHIDFFSALYGENEFPCCKCKRDCLDGIYYLQCDVFDDYWFHVDCKCNDPDTYDVI